MLNRLKAMANERDVPYQSLIKIILSERIAQELGSHAEGSYSILPVDTGAKDRSVSMFAR